MNIKFSSFYSRCVKLLVFIMLIHLLVLFYHSSFVGPKNPKKLTQIRFNQGLSKLTENKKTEEQIEAKIEIGLNKTTKVSTHMTRTNVVKVTQKSYDSRKFIITKEELELTKIITIMPNECNKYLPISVYIKMSVQSYKRRQILRETWVSDVKSHNISVYFGIGLTFNQTDQQIIEMESKKYGDLIQFGFIDAYHNLTLKTVSILRWTELYCRTRHVLVVDYDVLVNIDLILESLSNLKQGIYGGVSPNAWFRYAIRNKGSKWYMPENVYPKQMYPVYLSGSGGHLFSQFIVKTLLDGIDAFTGNILYLEDVFITGIIAEGVGVERYKSSIVGVITDCSKNCDLARIAVMIGCYSDLQMKRMWVSWNKTKQACKIT